MKDNKAQIGNFKGSAPEMNFGVSLDLPAPPLLDSTLRQGRFMPSKYAPKPLPYYSWHEEVGAVLKARYEFLGWSSNLWNSDWSLLRRTCGELHPAQVGVAQMEATIIQAPKAGARVTYIARYKSIWRNLRYLGIVPADGMPEQLLPKMRKPRAVPRPISRDEAELVMASARYPVNEWAAFACLGGFRAMEVSAVQGSWLENTYEGDYQLRVEGKTGIDTIPAHPRLVQIIQSHRTLGRLYTAGPSHLSETANAELRRLGIGGNKTFHSLRHFFITAIYQQTGDLLLASELGRHRNLNTTRGYAQLEQGRKREVLNQLFTSGVGEPYAASIATA